MAVWPSLRRVFVMQITDIAVYFLNLNNHIEVQSLGMEKYVS